jgi:hypothetical protein
MRYCRNATKSLRVLFLLLILSSCGQQSQVPNYGRVGGMGGPRGRGGNGNENRPRPQMEPVSVKDLDLVKRTQIVDEAGNLTLPKDPRGSNSWYTALLIVPQKDAPLKFDCTASHIASVLVAFAEHCLEARKDGEVYAEDHKVVFPDRNGELRVASLKKILYRGNQGKNDIAIALIDNDTANAWHSFTNNLSQGIKVFRDQRDWSARRSVLVSTMDPGYSRPDLKIKGADDPDIDTAIYSVKRCYMTMVPPNMLAIKDGKIVTQENGQPIDMFANEYQKISPTAVTNAFLDGCTTVDGKEPRSIIPGNSGALVIDDEEMIDGQPNPDRGKLSAVIWGIYLKSKFPNFCYRGTYTVNGQPVCIPVSEMPGGPDATFLAAASTFQSVMMDPEFQKNPDYNLVFNTGMGMGMPGQPQGPQGPQGPMISGLPGWQQQPGLNQGMMPQQRRWPQQPGVNQQVTSGLRPWMSQVMPARTY